MAVFFCKCSFYSLFFVWWYFFGRKDAFPGADGSTITQATNGNNAQTIPIYGADGNTQLSENGTGYRTMSIDASGVLSDNTSKAYSIKNPLSFILCPDVTPWDWYTKNTMYQDDALWNHGKSIKSNYDPCPTGWRIPQDGTWGDFLAAVFLYYIQGKQSTTGNYAATNGRLYKNMTWYPAAGRRMGFNIGQLNFIGWIGTSWSTTTDDVKVVYMNFHTTGLGPSSLYYRSIGMSIRCVQE